MKEKAFEYIDAIAAKLGVAAEHVYGVLVKQAIVTGIRDLFVGIILTLVVYAMVRLSFKYIEDSDGDILWLTIPVGIFASIFAMVGFYCGIGELINPEYYAIKAILDVLGGGK